MKRLLYFNIPRTLSLENPMSLAKDLRRIEDKRRKARKAPALGASYDKPSKKIAKDPYKGLATKTAKAPTKTRTKAEIDAMIKRLKALKPQIPEKSFFGDNNHHAIEAQITTLRRRLNDEQIAERFLPKDDQGEADEDDIAEGRTVEIESAAREAVCWLERRDPPHGGDPDLAKGWEDLAKSHTAKVKLQRP